MMTLEQFINQYRNAVHALFRACRFPPHEARVLTQQAFRRCARASLDPLTLENTLRDLLLEQAAKPDSPRALAVFIATAPGAISLSVPNIATAIDALDPSAREAVNRHYRQRASSAELSRQLKRSPAAVRQLLARARDAVVTNAH